MACSRGHPAGHFGTKIMYLAKFLTELLQILSFKTCIMYYYLLSKLILKFYIQLYSTIKHNLQNTDCLIWYKDVYI